MANSVSRSVNPAILLDILSFAVPAIGLPAQANHTTINSTYSNAQVYCQPTTWYGICWFVFTNYVLHALSVRSLAGENPYASTVFKLCCLLVPYTGLRRGLCLISRASNFAGNDLQRAARANALCMVIRKNDWRPRDGDTIDGCRLDLDYAGVESTPTLVSGCMNKEEAQDTMTMASERTAGPEEAKTPKHSTEVEKVSSSGEQEKSNAAATGNSLKIEVKDLYSRPPCQGGLEKLARIMIETSRFSNHPPSSSIVDHENVKIQGLCEMPPGYALSYVPGDIKIHPRFCPRIAAAAPAASISTPETLQIPAKTRIASSYNFPRILFSITQTVSGGYSLFKARGSQIDRYGYAAFGLTVVPYIVISIVNFVGSLLTSEYETVYLVHSSIMDEMIDRGGVVDGAVGTIDTFPENNQGLSSSEGEEKIELQGESMKFDYHNDTLRCHALDSKSPTLEAYSILPYEPLMPKPQPQPQRRLQAPTWCQAHSWILSPRKPPKTTGRPSISVPSHPSFIRLPRPRNQTVLDLLCMILAVIAVSTPYIVISVLTGWRTNESSSLQQNFTLTWIICGQVQGYMIGNIETLSRRSKALKGLLVVFICYGSYAVSGFYVVAQEMIEFGTCKAM